MKFARAYLILNGIILGGYGLYCLFNPQVLSQYAMLGLDNPVAEIEVRAMYGGLEFTLGLYLLLCGIRSQLTAQGLLLSVFAFAGLAGARAFGMALEGGGDEYNNGALMYESACLLLAFVFLQLGNRQVQN